MKLAAVALARRRRGPIPASDIWRRVQIGVGVLVGTLIIGTIGYVMLGLSLLDAVYQTVITVSTVGFTEVGEVTDSYRVFTIVLILVGAGSVLYMLGVLIETLVEGRLTREFGRRRMHKELMQLHDHVIVAGWGQVGESIVNSLYEAGERVVIVDRSQDIPEDHYRVVGDATEDDVLREAGIERAKALIVALNSDADAVYVTLSARSFSNELHIIARANSPEAESKLLRAGASSVVNPHRIGGEHMASLI